jgi:hypothetical protein
LTQFSAVFEMEPAGGFEACHQLAGTFATGVGFKRRLVCLRFFTPDGFLGQQQLAPLQPKQ